MTFLGSVSFKRPELTCFLPTFFKVGLVSLDGSNEIGFEGAKEIQKLASLGNLSHLELEVGWNLTKPKSGKCFAETFAALRNLAVLKFRAEQNELRDEGMKMFQGCFEKLQRLRLLEVFFYK